MPHKHFRLKTLGGLTLYLPGGAEDRELSTRRRKLAVLAYLAIVDKPVARATLVELFWGDQPEDRARHSLSDTLSSLRRVLGTAAVSARLADVQLDSVGAGLSIDARELALAAADGRHSDVVALYDGPFLPAFSVPGSQSFDAWSDQERLRLSKLFARSCRALCLEAEQKKDWAKSLSLGLRWLEADPLSTGAQLAVLKGHAADGSPDALKTALREFRQLEQRLSRDYGALPDRDVRELIESWQSRVNDAGQASRHPRTSGAATPPPVAAIVPDTLPAAVVSAPPPAPRRPTRRRAAGIVSIAAAIVIASVAWFNRSPATLKDGEFVLISEFANHTGDSMLTRSVGTAVAAALQQSERIVPLPRSRVASALVRMKRRDTTERLDVDVAREVAQREGVRLVLAGEIIQAGPTRQLISRIIEARSGDVLAVRTFRVASDASLFPAIDSMVAAMRRDLGEASATVARAVSLPQVTTASLPALKYFADGVAATRRYDSELAAQLFADAVAIDPNFASAHARLGYYYAVNNNVPKSAYHYQLALEKSAGLPAPEALQIQISAASSRGDNDKAVLLSRQYLALRPRDGDAWANLGYYLFAGRRMAEARAAYAVADSIAPLSGNSLLNVGSSFLSDVRVADRASFDSARHYYERAFKLQPALEYNTFYNHQYGTVLFGVGLPDSARATYDRMARRAPEDRARALRSTAFLEAAEGQWQSAVARFAQARALGTERKHWTSALRDAALEADLLLTLGERERAAEPLRRAMEIAMREPIETRALAFVAHAQVRAGNRTEAARLLARMRAAARDDNDVEQSVILAVEGADLLAAGRAAEARKALTAAFQKDSTTYPSTQMLLARALSATGDDTAALARWNAIVSNFYFGQEGQFDAQMAQAERAQVLERLGRTEEAIEVLRALVGRYPAPGSAPEPLALTEARRRLQLYETRRR